ncbi:hypothetical protein Slin15195_G032440 [Septoria linicola]|uniref:Uncharacterized protein n=1 Tax=Septoria linicola TaxID=215465 RepID=A0A9Q9AJ01_9PEZI|nr:hypothetical protein Slin14017_G031470 [Septoria linicola]USW49925.1 hypothetical protein Slin15195_G032440 [Septoria linicola]
MKPQGDYERTKGHTWEIGVGEPIGIEALQAMLCRVALWRAAQPGKAGTRRALCIPYDRALHDKAHERFEHPGKKHSKTTRNTASSRHNSNHIFKHNVENSSNPGYLPHSPILSTTTNYLPTTSKLEFIARQVETNLHNAGMKDTDKIASRHGRSLSTQKNRYINISITEIAAELEVPPTTIPTRAAEPPAATLAPPTPQTDDVSSVYSRTPSSRCKDYKNFLTGKLSSSRHSSRATSTTSKRSTREFMTSSVSSRRSEKSSKDNEKKKRGDTTPFAFPILSGCV